MHGEIWRAVKLTLKGQLALRETDYAKGDFVQLSCFNDNTTDAPCSGILPKNNLPRMGKAPKLHAQEPHFLGLCFGVF